jgi:Protein of unknown function (DUF2490)
VKLSRVTLSTIMALCPSVAGATVSSVDSQLWSELDATHPLSTDLSVTAILAARLGNDLPNPTLSASGLQFDHRVGSWTASATGYYVSIRNAQTGARTTVWLPAAALSYQFDVGAFSLTDRNRVEQLEGLPGSPTRYRNRASVYWRLSGDSAPTDVFATDEVFYDFSRNSWTRNRAQAGIQFHVDKAARLQVFYLRQNTTYGALDRLNVLGLTLQLDIE